MECILSMHKTKPVFPKYLPFVLLFQNPRLSDLTCLTNMLTTKSHYMFTATHVLHTKIQKPQVTFVIAQGVQCAITCCALLSISTTKYCQIEHLLLFWTCFGSIIFLVKVFVLPVDDYTILLSYL